VKEMEEEIKTQEPKNYFALRRVFPDEKAYSQHNPSTFNKDNQQLNLNTIDINTTTKRRKKRLYHKEGT
jgi:hypothetical protein